MTEAEKLNIRKAACILSSGMVLIRISNGSSTTYAWQR